MAIAVGKAGIEIKAWVASEFPLHPRDVGEEMVETQWKSCALGSGGRIEAAHLDGWVLPQANRCLDQTLKGDALSA